MPVQDVAKRAIQALKRHVLNGPTMGTRWSAVFYAPRETDLDALSVALQGAVDDIDNQMSPWKPDSVLSRFNAPPQGTWIDLPNETFTVVSEALSVNALTGGRFDPFVGTPVMAFGFGAAGPVPDSERIERIAQSWAANPRSIAFDRDGHRLCRKSEVALDLCGIAKGYGVDRLSEVLSEYGIARHLVAIDGEIRAGAAQPDGRGWRIGIEKPDETAREVALGIEIADMAVATSGNYRHVRDVSGQKVSHIVDPGTGRPVDNRLLSVSVLADTTMLADALATALMVMGKDAARAFAGRHKLSALMIEATESDGQNKVPTGRFVELVGSDKPI
jgi:FAD:protein FMN transferase